MDRKHSTSLDIPIYASFVDVAVTDPAVIGTGPLPRAGRSEFVGLSVSELERRIAAEEQTLAAMKAALDAKKGLNPAAE